MATRKNSEPNEAGQEAPSVIPPGVQADVQIKYKTHVDPNLQDARARELADLSELAGEDLDEPPPDEISAFCHTWQNFAGYPLAIIRLPDPPERRLAGNSYARPCFNLERLGDTTFDPSNLIGTLQFVNNNSGGVFRIWLADYNGAPIPGARVERIAIADPPRDRNQAQPIPLLQPPPAPAPAPQPAQRSESERKLEEVKDQLFNKALERALNPPQQVNGQAPQAPQLPPDQQAMLYMLGNTDFVGTMFGKLAELAQQAAGVTKEPTLKERALDAGISILSNNPAIIDRVSGIADRIVGRIFGADPRYDSVPTQPQPQQPIYQQTPAYMPASDGRRTTDDGQPSTVNGPATPPDAPEPDDMDDIDGDTMDIIDKLLALLNSDEPLALNNPLFLSLRASYPLKFRFAIGMIASQPLDLIVDWIKETGGPPYVSLLDGRSGPFLRERLAMLQTLIIEAKNNADTKAKTSVQSSDQKDKPEPPQPSSAS